MADPTDHLRRYADDIASAVSPARSRVAAMAAIGRAEEAGLARRRRPLAWRIQVSGALMAAFSVLNFAAAAIADNAVPGDRLYVLDRAYERVAALFGRADHTAERAREAEVLLERGDPTGALQVLAEASDVPEVAHAAALVLSADLDGELLGAHARTLVTGFGILASADDPRSREEALAAVSLVASQATEQAAATPPRAVDRPAHATETGKPDHASDTGKPDHASDTGRPDHASDTGRPDHASDTGRPDHASDTGKPDHAGQPGAETGTNGGTGEEADPSGQDGAPGQNQTPSGQDATPPGQDETPPGQDKTPPGQNQTPPGPDKTPPGQDKTPPGQDKTPPGQDKTPPGQDKTPPGQDKAPPGQGQTPPGQGGSNPGKGNSKP